MASMWLEQYKMDAEESFNSLPDDNKFSFIDFRKMASREWSRHEIPESARKFMDDKSRMIIIQVNSNIVYTNVPSYAKKEGVILESINDAAKSNNPFMVEVLDKKIISPSEDKVTAMNSAYFDSGVFLFIPANAKLKQPIYHLVFLSDSEKVVSKTIIRSEHSNNFMFVEENYSDGTEVFYNSTAEIYADENTSACFTNIQNMDKNAVVVTKRRAMVGRNSKMKWVVGRFGARTDISERSTVLNEEGATADDIELFMGSENQNFDIKSDMNHEKPNTKGNIIVKGVLDGSSKALSKGQIKIAKNAQKSDSFLAEHTLLLSKDAKMDTIPCLEIEANDVRCTHSASISQINDEHIFYIRSRCIDENESKKLAVIGFLNSVLENIDDSSIVSHIHEIIEKKVE